MKLKWPWSAPRTDAQADGSPELQLASIALQEIEQKVGAFVLGEVDPQRDFPNAVLKAREYQRNNGFVPAILRLRKAFYNYGLKFRPASGNKPDKAFTGWELANKRKLTTYAGEVWDDWDHFDNAVSYWMPNSEVGRPILLNLELCRYKDLFGKEILKYQHQLSSADIDALDMAAPLKASWKSNPTVLLDNDRFRVLKRNRLGAGFAYPGIMSVAKGISQYESMEVGDNIMAYVCRIVWEQHKMGHEIKGGAMQGGPNYFWKEERASAFEKAVKGKVGHVRITTNFDHDITYPYPDQAIFKGEKYQAVIDRLFWWALPFGHMIVCKAVQPYLMQILRIMAVAERELVGEYLDEVINLSFAPPEPVHVTWSERCFLDSRLAADLMKTGLASGPVSQTTFLEGAGLDPAEERERKDIEYKLPEAQTMPIYDANHGAPDGTNGRPAGTPDAK